MLHKLTLSAQKSSFPTALGLRVTGVDDSTFSCTGDAYSAITMPNADTHVARILQEDDTSLAYEFVSNDLLRTTTTTTHSLPTLHVLTGSQVPRIHGCTHHTLNHDQTFCCSDLEYVNRRTSATRASTRSRSVASALWQRIIPSSRRSQRSASLSSN